MNHEWKIKTLYDIRPVIGWRENGYSVYRLYLFTGYILCCFSWCKAGWSVDFCLPDPDPRLFSSDPTCNNGYVKLFSSWTTYNPETTNSSVKLWSIKSNFIPTYLMIYEYIFFSFRIKVGSVFAFISSWAGSEEKSFGSSSLVEYESIRGAAKN